MTIKERLLNNTQDFTVEELKSLAFGEEFEVIEEIEGEQFYLTLEMTTIIKVEDENRYFSIFWLRGLPEIEDDRFDKDWQPKEVRPQKRIIETTEWVSI